MKPSERLFFIALLPPQKIQNQITEIKHYFAQTYNSRHALKSPPHITLQPPFKWLIEDLTTLEHHLTTFALNSSPIPITLSGFNAFPPRVLFVNVIKTPELINLQQALMNDLEQQLNIVHEVSKKRSFSPHITVAFKDLTPTAFKTAWPEFAQRPIYFEFTVSELTLLIHDGQNWNIKAQFPFLNITFPQ
ncbi:2'-5' RNA ligase family protein [Planktothrix sp. FACHB-1365]|uniref:2'-5' RNA ligase family protein n=1 Tax=Planktothrix sp. FACHB-1365 TaxID=2692855 RepID=UPI00168962FD|nr:2'-5' RNA ligase family protein [Planktothrix sp. FACHB-1365]MBD2480545.1 2'-5' RNA ligase family protein [Planktothrix sp. FACHB-1365]